MTDADGELAGLYRRSVLEHSRSPRNFRRLAAADHQATGHNPLCGDKVTVYLGTGPGGVIADAAFEATGCAISLASASMLTEQVRGRTGAGALTLAADVAAMLAPDSQAVAPGELAALAGVRNYPSRVRCALLPWKTLEAAVRGEPGTTTEEAD